MTRVPTNRRPTTPGEMLVEEYLKPLNVSQTEFAKRVHVTYARLNEIVKGHRGVTPDTALRFARALGTSPDFWLNLQQAVDLYDAAHSPNAQLLKEIKPLVHA